MTYGFEPAVLVFADSDAGRDSSRAAVIAAGGRVRRTAPIEEAVALLDEQPAVDAVLIDVVRDPGEPLDRLLDRLDLAARDGRHASVVAIAPTLIDIAAARAPHSGVILLCDPDPIERTAAIGLALTRGLRSRVQERGEESPMQLRQLSEEVGRIARTLAALSADARPRETRGAQPPASDPQPDETMPSAAAIRALIRARRLRDQFFDAGLFADPAWDMLLDLLAARIEHRQVAVSSLCIAAAVPPTTALRWIKTLTDEGMFVRVADPRDGRRVFIELSDSAAATLAAYFHAGARAGLRLA